MLIAVLLFAVGVLAIVGIILLALERTPSTAVEASPATVREERVSSAVREESAPDLKEVKVPQTLPPTLLSRESALSRNHEDAVVLVDRAQLTELVGYLQTTRGQITQLETRLATLEALLRDVTEDIPQDQFPLEGVR